MIVIDAPALLELLLRTHRAEAIEARALAPDERLHAPHLLDVEIAQVLRRLVQLKEITPSRAQEAFDDHKGLVIERSAHQVLLPRIWQLGESVTAYDAAYVAPTEVLNAPLLTCDARLGARTAIAQRLKSLIESCSLSEGRVSRPADGPGHESTIHRPRHRQSVRGSDASCSPGAVGHRAEAGDAHGVPPCLGETQISHALRAETAETRPEGARPRINRSDLTAAGCINCLRPRDAQFATHKSLRR